MDSLSMDDALFEDDVLLNFVAITGCHDADQARMLLEACGDLQSAVQVFFDSVETAEAMDHQPATDNGTTPIDSDTTKGEASAMADIGATKVSGVPSRSAGVPRKEALRIAKNVMDLLDERGYLTLDRLCLIYDRTFSEPLDARKLLSILGSQDLVTAIRDFRPRIFEHLTTPTGEIAITLADDPEVDALEAELNGTTSAVNEPKPGGSAFASPPSDPSDSPSESTQPSTLSMPPKDTLSLPPKQTPMPIRTVKTAPLFNLSGLAARRGRSVVGAAQRAQPVVKQVLTAQPAVNGAHPISKNDEAALGSAAAQPVLKIVRKLRNPALNAHSAHPPSAETEPVHPMTAAAARVVLNSAQTAQPVLNGAHPPSDDAVPAHPTTTAAARSELKNDKPAQGSFGAAQTTVKGAEPTQPASTKAATSGSAAAAPQEFGPRAVTSTGQPASMPAEKPVEPPPQRSVKDAWRAKWESGAKPKKERWEAHVDYFTFLHLASRDRAICLNEFLRDVAKPIWKGRAMAKYSVDSIVFLLETHFAECFKVTTLFERKYEVRAVSDCPPSTKLESLRRIMTGTVRVQEASALVAVRSTHSVMVKPGLNEDDHDVMLVPFALLRGATGGAAQNGNAENGGLPECHVAYQRKIRPLLRKLRGNCRLTELKPGACVLQAKERCVIQESDGYEVVVRSLDTGECRRANADELYDPIFVDEFTAYPSLVLYARVVGYRCRQTKAKVQELHYGLATAKFVAYKPLPDGRTLHRVELSSPTTTPSPPPPPSAVEEPKAVVPDADAASGAISLTDLLGPNADPDLLAALQLPSL